MTTDAERRRRNALEFPIIVCGVAVLVYFFAPPLVPPKVNSDAPVVVQEAPKPKPRPSLPEEQTAQIGSTVTLTHSYWACQDWDTYEALVSVQVRDNDRFKFLLEREIYTLACTILSEGTPVIVSEQGVTSVRWRRADDKQFRAYWISKGTFKE